MSTGVRCISSICLTTGVLTGGQGAACFHCQHFQTWKLKINTYSPCRTWGVKNATDPTFRGTISTTIDHLLSSFLGI